MTKLKLLTNNDDILCHHHCGSQGEATIPEKRVLLLNPLLDANIFFLKQGVMLLEKVKPEVYSATCPPMYKSGIGPHFRHCLDHYQTFLDGLAAGAINYDARQRNTPVENDPVAALAWIDELLARMVQEVPTSPLGPLTCQMRCGAEPVAIITPTSMERELQFLVSHTVHHYALIAMVLRHQGVEVAPDFGVAPSTLRDAPQYSALCAR